MSKPNEDSLDRHYASQLQVMSAVFIKSVCPFQNYIINRWLLVFHNAPAADKYARNCLMVLMLEHLKKMDKLGTPFTDLANTKLPLEEVLTIYETKSNCETRSLKEQMQSERVTEEPSKAAVVEKYVESDLDTNYGNDMNHSSGKLSTEEKFDFDSRSSGKQKSYYEPQSEKNRLLLKEVNSLIARTVENEHHFLETKSKWKKMMNQSLQTKQNQMLLQKVELNIRYAIRRLKDWTPSKGPMNFMLTILQDILDDVPETRRVVGELDRQMERELNNLLEQEGERREMNVRVLYDQLLLLQLLPQEQQALTEPRQQIQAKERVQNHKENSTQTSFHIIPIKEHRSRKSNSRKLVTPSPSLSSSSLLVHIQSNKGLENNNKCDCESCQQLERKFLD